MTSVIEQTGAAVLRFAAGIMAADQGQIAAAAAPDITWAVPGVTARSAGRTAGPAGNRTGPWPAGSSYLTWPRSAATDGPAYTAPAGTGNACWWLEGTLLYFCAVRSTALAARVAVVRIGSAWINVSD